MPQRCGHHRDRRCSVCEMSLVDVRCSGPAGRTTPVFNGSTTWPRARAPCSRRQACGTAPHRGGRSVGACGVLYARGSRSLARCACVRACVCASTASIETHSLAVLAGHSVYAGSRASIAAQGPPNCGRRGPPAHGVRLLLAEDGRTLASPPSLLLSTAD